MNPGGSVKDRIARAIVDDAEARDVLRPGMTLIEATAGNTGVGLAPVAGGRRRRAGLRHTGEDVRRQSRRALASLGARHHSERSTIEAGQLPQTERMAAEHGSSSRLRVMSARSWQVPVSGAVSAERPGLEHHLLGHNSWRWARSPENFSGGRDSFWSSGRRRKPPS